MSEHEQMIERHVVWMAGVTESETERPICGYCWHEDPSGSPRRADWPCSTVKARQAVALLNSMVLSGESHSDQSRAVVRAAMDDTPPPAGGREDGQP